MPLPTSLKGFDGMVDFLNYLHDQKITYRLDHSRAESVMASLTLVGARIEVEFFSDHIEFSIFTGDESVSRDTQLLYRTIDKHWGD